MQVQKVLIKAAFAVLAGVGLLNRLCTDSRISGTAVLNRMSGVISTSNRLQVHSVESQAIVVLAGVDLLAPH